MEKVVSKSSVSGSVLPPCSKSYAQRAMASALLAEGESVLGNIEFCDDTRHALDAIIGLGAEVTHIDGCRISIRGGLAPQRNIINTGESGLAARLFTPIASLSDRRITITGKGTMLKRPIGMMIKPLEDLGVKVESDGYLPITVRGPLRGGETETEGFVSSQFITGLLTALPLAGEDTILKVNKLNSIPYLAMTVDMASRFGIRIQHNDYSEFFVEGGQKYLPSQLEIEGDWSSAAFMLVAGAVAGRVTVENMSQLSLQADVAVIDALRYAGAEVVASEHDIEISRRELRAFEFDATQCPDLFPIIAVLAANCEGKSIIKGVRRLIHKESNRAEAILNEFAKIGIRASLKDDDHMEIIGGNIRGGAIDSCNDHRIAMAGAIAGLTAEAPVIITNAQAVNKSYPRFWEDLEKLTANN